jgi:hypothetical protein
MKDLWSINPIPAKRRTHCRRFCRAGIWAEFGKSRVFHYFCDKGDVRNFRVTSFFMKREDFEGFQSSIRQSFQSTTTYFVRPYAKEFDIPFLARRMIINQIPPT